MKLRVLGCAGAEFPGYHPPGFLVDEILLLDAGTIGAALNEVEQRQIRYIFVTHSHLDHVRGIPVLADNLVARNVRHTVHVAGCHDTIFALRTHLMNDVLWPDFAKLPTPKAPAIRYMELLPEQEVVVEGYSITPVPVSHTVPAVGYVVRKGGKGFFYTGDTGPTERIWAYVSGLDALIVEVSFPNDMEEVAITTGHLTPQLLAEELKKVAILPPRIFLTHPKPQYFALIEAEVAALGIRGVELLRDGSRLEV